MEPFMALAIILVVAHSAYTIRKLSENAAHERELAARERAEIMTRIQAPERILLPQEGPVGARPPLHVVPEDEGELAKVGMILVGDGEQDTD